MKFGFLRYAVKNGSTCASHSDSSHFSLRTNSGFTFIEVLVVIAVLGILATITVSSFSDYAARQQHSSEINDVIRSVIEQRSRALAALNDTEHGVYASTSIITMFEGTTYSAGTGTNRSVTLLYTTATSSFSNGLLYISFAKITGEPSATGTIQLYSQRLQSTATITIYASGLIE